MDVVCLGAGKLAHHLMPALQLAGCNIVQVYNRSPLSVSKIHAATHTTDLKEIEKNADLYIIALSDDAIGEIAQELAALHEINGIVVHCSGVLGIEILPFNKRGVFYPLQTFSEHHDVDWKSTPIIITAENKDVADTLKVLANK